MGRASFVLGALGTAISLSAVYMCESHPVTTRLELSATPREAIESSFVTKGRAGDRKDASDRARLVAGMELRYDFRFENRVEQRAANVAFGKRPNGTLSALGAIPAQVAEGVVDGTMVLRCLSHSPRHVLEMRFESLRGCPARTDVNRRTDALTAMRRGVMLRCSEELAIDALHHDESIADDDRALLETIALALVFVVPGGESLERRECALPVDVLARYERMPSEDGTRIRRTERNASSVRDDRAEGADSATVNGSGEARFVSELAWFVTAHAARMTIVRLPSLGVELEDRWSVRARFVSQVPVRLCDMPDLGAMTWHPVGSSKGERAAGQNVVPQVGQGSSSRDEVEAIVARIVRDVLADDLSDAALLDLTRALERNHDGLEWLLTAIDAETWSGDSLSVILAALGMTREPRIEEWLANGLVNESRSATQRAALARCAIGRTSCSTALWSSLNHAARDWDDEVASTAMLALGALDAASGEGTRRLSSLESSAAANGRTADWLEGLGNTRSDAVLEIAPRYLDASDASIRLAAVRSLRHVRTRAHELLRAVMAKDASEAVRKAAARILAQG